MGVSNMEVSDYSLWEYEFSKKWGLMEDYICFLSNSKICVRLYGIKPDVLYLPLVHSINDLKYGVKVTAW